MNIRNLLVVLFVMMFLSGCATATKSVIQVHGYPMPEGVISVNLFDYDINLTYSFQKHFKVYEGNESFEYFEYLSLFHDVSYGVKDGDSLIMEISIFNPLKHKFKIVKTIEHGDEVNEVVVYEGSISRNKFSIHLPKTKNPATFQFSLVEGESNTIYWSFKARYHNIGGTTNPDEL